MIAAVGLLALNEMVEDGDDVANVCKECVGVLRGAPAKNYPRPIAGRTSPNNA